MHRIGRTGRAGASGLAVSFVGGGNDARLLADIEKLIKKKCEVEPMDMGVAERPPRRDSVERDRGDRLERSDRVERREHTERAPRRESARTAAPRDPFFDKPYEPAAAPEAPSWEPAKPPSSGRSISANIKPKRVVAALFKSV